MNATAPGRAGRSWEGCPGTVLASVLFGDKESNMHVNSLLFAEAAHKEREQMYKTHAWRHRALNARRPRRNTGFVRKLRSRKEPAAATSSAVAASEAC